MNIQGVVTDGTKLPKPGTVNSALFQVIRELTFKLVGMVKVDKLSGQVLNRKTGRLSRSVAATFLKAGSEGVVGTNVVYGRQHEYGGEVPVKEHMRLMKQAWGRPVANPREILVSAHIKKLPERSFLRSALRELEPQIQPAIDKAIKNLLKK